MISWCFVDSVVELLCLHWWCYWFLNGVTFGWQHGFIFWCTDSCVYFHCSCCLFFTYTIISSWWNYDQNKSWLAHSMTQQGSESTQSAFSCLPHTIMCKKGQNQSCLAHSMQQHAPAGQSCLNWTQRSRKHPECLQLPATHQLCQNSHNQSYFRPTACPSRSVIPELG